MSKVKVAYDAAVKGWSVTPPGVLLPTWSWALAYALKVAAKEHHVTP